MSTPSFDEQQIRKGDGDAVYAALDALRKEIELLKLRLRKTEKKVP